jgi:hypothetical protein
VAAWLGDDYPMTCSEGNLVFGLTCLGALIAIVRYCACFNAYCARIAQLENRVQEFRSLKSIEGGGINLFELAQSAATWRRDHRRFGDERLNQLAMRLYRSGFIGLAAMILAGACGVYLEFGLCGAS